MFTPYKLVAYEAWQAARQKQEPPATSYGDAQRTRITVGLTAVKGSTNPIVGLDIKRGGQVIKPATQSSDGAGGLRSVFDVAAFAPTAGITLD